MFYDTSRRLMGASLAIVSLLLSICAMASMLHARVDNSRETIAREAPISRWMSCSSTTEDGADLGDCGIYGSDGEGDWYHGWHTICAITSSCLGELYDEWE